MLHSFAHPCRQVSWVNVGRVAAVVGRICTKTMDGYVRGGRNEVGRAGVTAALPTC